MAKDLYVFVELLFGSLLCCAKCSSASRPDSFCAQEKQDVFLSTWAEKLKGRRLGCFIIDAPMGLHGDSAWSLNQVITLVKSIEQWCTPPYTIVLYSLHSMSDVQRALVEAESKSKGKQGKGLQVTRFIMVKVSVIALCRHAEHTQHTVLLTS